MLVVLGAVDAVVPPTITNVRRQRIPELREQLLPRRSPTRRLRQRSVEVEDDRFRHASSLAQGCDNLVNGGMVRAVGIDMRVANAVTRAQNERRAQLLHPLTGFVNVVPALRGFARSLPCSRMQKT